MGVEAARAGRKTLVLTIDPSLRLARTLGVDLSRDVEKVPGADYPLWAGIVNHQKSFDEFVEKASGSRGLFDRVMNNHLFQQLRTSLAGSQDFTSLQTLYRHVNSGEFDLVILDTPPAQHALEFIDAPEKIAHLFGEGVARWFRDPKMEKMGVFRKIVSTGTKQMLKVLEALTGSQFIAELADFFNSVQSWQGFLVERTEEIKALLRAPTTAFYLVTSGDKSKIDESRRLLAELESRSLRVKALLINRAYPAWWGAGGEPPAAIMELYSKHKSYAEGQQAYVDRVFPDFTSNKGKALLRLQEEQNPIADLKDLEKFAQQLKGLP